MTKTNEYDGEFQPHDVRCWRDGNWYFVDLAGELLARRYSRTGRISGARVHFSCNRSPRDPRTRENLRTAWAGGNVEWLSEPVTATAARPSGRESWLAAPHQKKVVSDAQG